MPWNLISGTPRINGAKSHGPKTLDGLAMLLRNALKLGLTSARIIILHSEGLKEFRNYWQYLLPVVGQLTPLSAI